MLLHFEWYLFLNLKLFTKNHLLKIISEVANGHSITMLYALVSTADWHRNVWTHIDFSATPNEVDKLNYVTTFLHHHLSSYALEITTSLETKGKFKTLHQHTH